MKHSSLLVLFSFFSFFFLFLFVPTAIASISVDDFYGTEHSTISTANFGGTGAFQSFTSGGGILDHVSFYMGKWGSPTGTVRAYLYADSGTYGSSSDTPTGSALATSDEVDVTTLLFEGLSLTNFTFTGSNRITLSPGTHYVVGYIYNLGDATNHVRNGTDASGSPSHPGATSYWVHDHFVTDSTKDTIFYLYVDSAPAKIISSPSSSTVTVGVPFVVDVAISDAGAPFNAAQASVTLSSNLSVTGFASPTANACNLHYTDTPSSSHLSFAGAIFNGSASNCNVYKLTLTPTATGTGTMTFTNASLKSYADNSEILTGVQNGSYTIGAGATPTPTPTPLEQLTVNSPEVTYLSSFNLTGTKDSLITSVFVNASSSATTYPTATTWLTPVTLSLGVNNFILYGRDGGGNQTATITTSVNRHTLGDINGDGLVNIIDASLFAVDWGKTSNLTYRLSDMNGDGSVDLTDLSILAKLEMN